MRDGKQMVDADMSVGRNAKIRAESENAATAHHTFCPIVPPIRFTS
jgi:hypothetical protein